MIAPSLIRDRSVQAGPIRLVSNDFERGSLHAQASCPIFLFSCIADKQCALEPPFSRSLFVDVRAEALAFSNEIMFAQGVSACERRLGQVVLDWSSAQTV